MKIFLITIIISLFSISCISQDNEVKEIKVVPPLYGVYFGAFACGSTEDSVTPDRLNEIKKYRDLLPHGFIFLITGIKKLNFLPGKLKRYMILVLFRS